MATLVQELRLASVATISYSAFRHQCTETPAASVVVVKALTHYNASSRVGWMGTQQTAWANYPISRWKCKLTVQGGCEPDMYYFGKEWCMECRMWRGAGDPEPKYKIGVFSYRFTGWWDFQSRPWRVGAYSSPLPSSQLLPFIESCTLYGYISVTRVLGIERHTPVQWPVYTTTHIHLYKAGANTKET